MDYDRLPPAAIDRVIELIERFHLKSVGAEEYGFIFWSRLCELQLMRSRAMNCTPKEALQLYASDQGVPENAILDGSSIHVSYEGIVPGAITVLPDWRVFFVDDVLAKGNLGVGVCSQRFPHKPKCQILVTDRDFGELPCASRERVDGWWFYSENELLANCESAYEKLQ